MPIIDHEFYSLNHVNEVRGTIFSFQTYYKQEYERHYCTFCMTRFMEGGGYGTEGQGFVSPDGVSWICRRCFYKFQHEYELHTRAEE